MDELFAGLQASAFAQAMRTSTFLYPLANVLHVLGAMAFFAAVAAMDVKAFRSVSIDDLRDFIRKVRPFAFLAFLIQVASGAMLLAPEALHIFHNPVFRLKLIAIVIGLINVIVLEAAVRRPGVLISPAVKSAAGASLAIWLAVAALGRLTAYL
jgi:hypothetical protein